MQDIWLVLAVQVQELLSWLSLLPLSVAVISLYHHLEQIGAQIVQVQGRWDMTIQISVVLWIWQCAVSVNQYNSPILQLTNYQKYEYISLCACLVQLWDHII